MSHWRVDEEPPANFFELLDEKNDEEDGDTTDEEMCEYKLDLSNENELSPLRRASLDRSRSPIEISSSSESAAPSVEMVPCVFDECDVPTLGAEEEVFLTPDTHELYVSPCEDRDRMNREERHKRGMSGRRGRGRRVRGVRGQSARSGYPIRVSRGGHRWVVGQPLNEIWTSDEDVPLDFRSLAKDVLKKSQRLQGRIKRHGEREVACESKSGDEFLDASNGADARLRLESQNFEWSSMESFQGQAEKFKPERTGSVNLINSAYDAFRSYWSDDIISLIVAETNQYATKFAPGNLQDSWHPTNNDEILCLFAFWMMLGIVRMPTMASCFSTHPLLQTEVYRRIFTRKRFLSLSSALHFVDAGPSVNNQNPSNTSASSFDQMHRLRPIITHLNSTFQSNYILHRDICIDVSLCIWKGKLNLKQYDHNYACRYGLKTYELCESSTGYLWSFIVYTDKPSAADLEQSNGLKSTAIVKKLIGPLLNKGYRLFMGNWYNSPLLARFLKLNGTDCVGTLRPSRRHVPVLINKAPLKRGQYIARHSGDVTVLSWQDKKRVTMISTCHDSSTALPTVPSKQNKWPVPFKPQVVLDYNKFMGGVDLKDQLLGPYLLEGKRCKKWYMKLFKRLLNVSIVNARILLQSSKQKYQDKLSFRLQLVDSILAKHLSHRRQSRCTVSIKLALEPPCDRYIVSNHWPVLLEPTASSIARKRHFSKRCVVCIAEGRSGQKSPYCCEYCRVPLCIKECFKSYHTPKT